MDLSAFSAQIERLKETYGERNYPNTRVELFWGAFKASAEDEFREAVDECIGNLRQPPMFKELSEALAQVRARRNDLLRQLSSRGFGELEKAATRSADPEFAKLCVQVICEKYSGKLSREQFWGEALPFIENWGKRKR